MSHSHDGVACGGHGHHSAPKPIANVQRFCNISDCVASPSTLKCCSKCKVAMYCGRDHQVADWGKHKFICDDLAVAQQQGFVKKIITEGTGEQVQKGKKVKVHYTGALTNGEVFDSSETRNKPFEFVLGVGQVIKGWDEGVATMKIGEKALLICSPGYGYGAHGAGDDIPPFSSLLFTVTCLGQ